MKHVSLATLMPLDINGTLSPSGAESIGIILAIGMAMALIGWITGKFWFMPYLEYRQKMIGKQNYIKSAKSKRQKVADIANRTDTKTDDTSEM